MKECKIWKQRHTNSLHDYTTKKPKEKLKKGCEEKENEQKDFHCNSEHEFRVNKYMYGVCNGKA